MAKKVLSIELGNSTTRICQLDYKKKNPRVYYHIVIPTPVESIRDGYLEDPEAIAGAIKTALLENGVKGTKDVIFTIASTKIITREQALPQMKPNALASLIQTNLSEYFPIDVNNYEVTHTILGKITDGKDEGKMRVMIMAAEKELVNSYKALAMKCGLTLLMLDQVGNSIYQVVKNEDAGACKMVFKIEEEQTNVTVIKGDNLLLQRNVGFGIDAAIQEVMNQPAFVAPNYDQAWKLICDKVCIRASLGGSDSSDGGKISQKDYDSDYANASTKVTEPEEGAAMTNAKIAVTESLTELVKGLQRVLNYYNSTNQSYPIDRILICGIGGRLNGLSKLLSNELEIPTNKLRRLENVHYHVLGDEADLYNYVACIGATFAPVGFYSDEKEKKKKRETNYISLSVLVAILTAVVAGVFVFNVYTRLQEQKDIQSELKTTESRYLESEQVYNRYEKALALYMEIAQGTAMMDLPSNGIVDFLEELEDKMPSSLTVSQFTSNNESFVMNLSVSTKDEAAGLIEELRKFESLDAVSISSITESREEIKVEQEEEAEDEAEADEKDSKDSKDNKDNKDDKDTKDSKTTETKSKDSEEETEEPEAEDTDSSEAGLGEDGLPVVRTGVVEVEYNADGDPVYYRRYVSFTVSCVYHVETEEDAAQ